MVYNHINIDYWLAITVGKGLFLNTIINQQIEGENTCCITLSR